MEEFLKDYYNMWGQNVRHDFYCEEGIIHKMNQKKVGKYLKKLKECGDDYKI